MSHKAILDGKRVVPINDLMTWSTWIENNLVGRRVAQTVLGNVRISTVFLGLDHAFAGGQPLWFETMIFGGSDCGYQERYSTWSEAEDGHARAVALVKNA